MRTSMKFNPTIFLVSLILLMVFPSCKVDSDEDTKPEPKAKYTVSFDSNGGTAVESQTVESGSKATKPKDPTKVGYSLSSWRNENSAFDFSTPITKNLNLVAVWQANKYTVALVNNGNRSEITATYDSNLSNLSTIPTLENSEFGGYYTEPFAKGTKYIDSEGKGCHVWDIANDDTILYAAWGYKINYENTKDLENPNPEIYTDEERFVLSDLKSITGYNFVGWYDSETEGNKVTSIESGETGAKTLYARWEAVNYTISYDINGGKLAEENENPTSFTIESDTITLKTPAKNGYTFAGWYRDGTKVTEIPKGTTENIDLTAEWSIVTYSITYDLNKGTNSEENPSSYTIETDTITLKAATREGHDFVGWYDDDKDGTKIEAIQKGEFGEKKLYARWEAKTYTISYDLDGGVLEEENPDSYTIVKKSDEVIALNEPTKNGYTFLGWYFNGEKYTEISFGTIGNLSFKAMWSPISYSIIYDLNKGTNSEDNPSSYNSETATIILKDATRTGYEFLGWYDSNIDGNKITSVPKGSFGEKTLYAKWKLTTYTISYNLNGGTLAEGDENPTYYTVESETIILNSPTRSTYVFDGWYSNGKKYEKILHGTTGDLTLSAKWTPIAIYAVSFNANASDVTGSMSNIYAYSQTSVTLPENAFARSGYIFMGWATLSSGEKVYDDKAQITLSGNLILYAVWLEESYVPYTVQHLLQNAEDDDYTLTATETKYGKILAQTNAQAKTYEHFTAAPIVQKKLPVEGTTYIQVLYDREIVTLRFDSANGDEVQSASGKWGASYTKPQEPERFGYTFKKWSPALPDTLESKTCTAQWTPIPYSISYEGIDDAENPNTSTAYTIESEITLQNAKKTGYTFLGWYDGSKKVTEIPLGSTGNITLTAQWKENALSPMVTLDSVASQIPTLAITLEAGIFTATGGFKTYLWKIDGKVAQNGSGNTYTPDASELSGGHHNITLFVTAENGTYNSATAVFTVNK